MTDESLRGPKDRSRVDIDDEVEVRFWCCELKCTEEQLRMAVDRVGPLVDDVRRALSWGPSPTRDPDASGDSPRRT
jgi:hypothetical protein